jgi:serine/threonine protein kinase
MPPRSGGARPISSKPQLVSSEHKYALPPGSRLREYTIVRLLGHGGFGLTYLADHAKLHRKVAIKELLPVDFAIRETDGTTVVARSEQDRSNFEWARERFVEEGQTLAGLHHPSILPVHDILEEHGTAYLVTPFIDGGSMEEWLREVRRPAESDLRSVTHHILDALTLVHASGYLHRDVKPQNILMDRQNGLPVLIDFGNARIASGAKTSNLTSVITKGYAPFEQYQTKGRQGAFTDLYALGAVLYRSIKGVAPDDAADRWDEDKLEPLCHRQPPGYSLEFLATVDKALRMRREDRWQTCGEWKAALSLSNQPPASPPPPPPAPKPPARPKPPALSARIDRQRTPRAPALPPPPPPVSKPARLPKPAAIRRAAKRPKASSAMGWLIIPAVFLFAFFIIWFYSTPSHTAVNPDAEKPASDASETDLKTPLAPTETPLATTPAPLPPVQAPVAQEQPAFVNSLGQEFVPVPGTKVLFCRWDTRVRDWQAFIQEEGDVTRPGLYALDEKELKWGLKKGLGWQNPGFAQTGQHPVVGVSWEDAHRFCAWLSRKEGRTYRLPTDAEWTAAVGSQTYPWGNSFPPPQGAGNYAGSESRLATDGSGTPGWRTIEGYNDGFPRTSPVGSFAANWLGLYDMGGNVWQWCEDEYKASIYSAEILEKIPDLKNEQTEDGIPFRVARGGAWNNNDPFDLQSAVRDPYHPKLRGDFCGFRCVLVLPGG